MVLVGLTGAMHVFFGVAVFALARRLHPSALAAAFAGVALAVLGVLLFVSRIRLAMPDRRRNPLAVRFIDIPFYVHFCAAFFTLPIGMVASLTVPLWALVRGEPVSLPADFVLATYLVGLALASYGILIRRRFFRVERHDVTIPNLANALDGFRIVQLSDLHIGALTPKSWADAWVRAANREGPHLAVVTGDMVSSGVEFHDDIADALAGLKAVHGAFVSMGNHDYFGEGEPLISRLQAKGCTVLRNEGTRIDHEGGSLYLAAVDDTWTGRADLERTLEGRPPDVPVVLLAHEPALFDRASEAGVALTLSGHTHGGQVAVPFLARLASLSHLTHQYHVGIYRRGDAVLHVHPGLGTTGPPVRLGVAPAIVVLTLRCGAAGAADTT